MNGHIISTLVKKDLSLYFRNRFFAMITILGLVFYIVIYFVMPQTVDENLKIGLYAPVNLPVFEQIQEEGLEINAIESEQALKDGVIDGQFVAGIALPADILGGLSSGQKPKISIYFISDIPEEIKGAVEVMITELIFLQTGQALPVEFTEEIIGIDMAGAQIPPRNRMRPLFTIMIILTETLGLATLISEELERRTAQALLVTPVSVVDLFTAKGISGVGLAFVQSVLLMAIIGGLSRQPLLILTTLLLGAIMVTGIAFIIGSLGRDMMSTMGWGFLVIILMFIPTFGAIIPGITTGWVKAIPSYYLVDTIHRTTNFGASWGDVWLNLVILTGFIIAFVSIGIWALRRKTQ